MTMIDDKMSPGDPHRSQPDDRSPAEPTSETREDPRVAPSRPVREGDPREATKTDQADEAPEDDEANTGKFTTVTPNK